MSRSLRSSSCWKPAASGLEPGAFDARLAEHLDALGHLADLVGAPGAETVISFWPAARRRMSPARFSTGRTMAARDITIRTPAKIMPATTAAVIRISENTATLLARGGGAGGGGLDLVGRVGSSRLPAS